MGYVEQRRMSMSFAKIVDEELAKQVRVELYKLVPVRGSITKEDLLTKGVDYCRTIKEPFNITLPGVALQFHRDDFYRAALLTELQILIKLNLIQHDEKTDTYHYVNLQTVFRD